MQNISQAKHDETWVVFIFKTHGTLSAFALRFFLVPTRWRSSHKATAQEVKSSTNG